MKKRAFVTEYVGLSTRLEALALAFLISDYYGHEVCIDWRELDALRVVGAHVRRRGVLGRLGALKLHDDTVESAFHRIARHRNVNVRTHRGPRHLLERYYLPTARRIKLRPDLIEAIRAGFAPYAQRPLVAVHVRRGDFAPSDGDTFDVNAAQWPATPDWWYVHAMRRVREAVPDVAFYVACSGRLEDYPHLTREFDVFEMPTTSPYVAGRAGHESQRHPAADLFALGCCTTLIGSTCSTYSHYAANMLGEPTTVLLPPQTMHRDAPAVMRLDMHGRGAFDWYRACRTGEGMVPLRDPASLPLRRGASLGWM